ncbi:hypothetical protein BRC62_00600 [Halobacteriales archaeon QH_10_67_13]|nr:MAG: hypothetical protein BRC62_00600 [Halobacteriales archaeon QH_10_67_13]
MLGIVVSRADEASVTIAEQLRELADWSPDGEDRYRTDGAQLRYFNELHTELDRPAAAFDNPDLLAVASRHSGDTGALLTAHHTGNVGPAEYGGAPNELSRAAPNAHARVIAALEEFAPPEYEVGTEVTHHGPSTVGAPSLFVELGSGPDHWTAPAPARAVARAILTLRGVDPDRPGAEGYRHVVGFGDGHYAPRIERVLAETDWAVGHVAADWALDAITDEALPTVVESVFERSRATRALVEGTRPAVTEQIERLGYRAVGERFLRETTGVSLSLVATAERRLCPVNGGLRFGDPARTAADIGVVCRLPEELLAEARGIDRTGTTETVAEAAIAFETDQGGTRPTGLVALPAGNESTTDPDALAPGVDPTVYERLLDALLEVLAERYETIDREDGTAIAASETFDPERARTLGISEGPAFGRLAAGEPVEVDGEWIPPEVVHERRERRFPLAVDPAD